MRKVLTALAMAMVLAGGAASVHAANLVTNGDFEADNAAFTASGSNILPYSPKYPGPYPSGWIPSGAEGLVNTFSNSAVDSGQASVQLGGGAAAGSISQTLMNLDVGATYTVSFYVGVNDPDLGLDSAAVFDATFGTTDLLTGASSLVANGVTGVDVGLAVSNSGFEEFITPVVASASSMTLTFTGTTTDDNPFGDDGPWYLDDVDVEAPAVAAPEPSSLLLLLPMLAAIPLVRRRNG